MAVVTDSNPYLTSMDIILDSIQPGQKGGKIGHLSGNTVWSPINVLHCPFPCGVFGGSGDETIVNLLFDLGEVDAA